MWLDHSLSQVLSTSLRTGAGAEQIVDILIASHVPEKAARALATALTAMAHAGDVIAAADQGNGVTIRQPWVGSPTVATR